MAEATVIEALVVELGLDLTKLTKDQQEALRQYKKTEEELKRRGAEVERQTADALGNLQKMARGAAGLFAAFTAGRGIKDFVQDVVASNAALGRQAHVLDANAQKLYAWQKLVESVGGSADDLTGSVRSIAMEFERYKFTGQSAILPWLSSPIFRGLRLGTPGHMLPIDQILEQMSGRFRQMDPLDASFIAQQIGISPSLLNAMLLDPKDRRGRLTEFTKLAPTDKDIGSAQTLQQSFTEIEATSRRLGTTLLTEVTPQLRAFATSIDRIGDALQSHPALLNLLAGGLGVTGVSGSVASGAEFALGLFGVKGLARLFGIGGGAAASGGAAAEASGGLAAPLGFDLGGGAAATAAGAATVSNPVGWTVAGLAALGIGGYELYRNKDWIKRIIAPYVGGANVAGGTYSVARGDEAIKFFQSRGLSRTAAVGITANLLRESDLNPQARGDNGSAYGVGQWHKDRQAIFAKVFGHSIQYSTLAEQLAFVVYELQHNEKRAGNAVLSAKSIEDSVIGGIMYERPRAGLAELPARLRIAARLNGKDGGSSVHIENLTVHTQATDAKGIARSIGKELEQIRVTSSANSGPH